MSAADAEGPGVETVIAGYSIERRLGAGGMGAVYLAKHPTLAKSVALKVLSAELSADPNFRARFRREAEIAATLDHPNIVQVYTRGETDDHRLWIAMQFVDGTDVGALLKSGPLDPARVVDIVNQIAGALDYAHSRKILHRDIKPPNILLAGPDGPEQRALLADFGIARALDEMVRLTVDGSIVATLAYASPEAIEGRPLDHRSDLYSLGCTVYRMLTGRTPFSGVGTDSPTQAQMAAHLWQPPPRPSDVIPGLPPDFDAVIATAMAKDPAERFQSARDLAAATAAALAGQRPVTGATPERGADATPITYPSGHFSGATVADPGEPPIPQQPQPSGVPKFRRPSRRVVGAIAGVAATALVAALALRHPVPYPVQDFVHSFGSTRLERKPDAVAALGPGDADVVTSLGGRAAAAAFQDGTVPSWLREIAGRPDVVSESDTAALRSAKPDLVIDTGPALDQDGYTALAAVAPTIGRPASGRPFSNDVRLHWIADILGAQDRVTALLDEAEGARQAIKEEHPDFTGKSVAVFEMSDAGLAARSSGSPAAGYLTGIGFSYTPALTSGQPVDITKTLTGEDVYRVKSDIAIVLRTDKDARNGGYYGLPFQFDTYPGPVMVVDDRDTVAALQSAGPAATRYLNATLVPRLAEQLR